MADPAVMDIGDPTADERGLEPGESMRGVTGREAGFVMRIESGSPDAGSTDKDGRDWGIKVDDEHKAAELPLWKFWQAPHMRSFYVSTISFFISFVSTFAAAPLIPIIRDDLNLTKADVSASGIAAVTGTVLMRVAMGVICDIFGPRYGHGFLMLLIAPVVFGMAGVTTAGGFITCRLFIGLGLATFVANQFWGSILFNRRVVGAANATSAGWGNLGGGITNLLMPQFFAMFNDGFNISAFASWRWAYFIPGTCHIVVGILVLWLGKDLPDGNYEQLRRAKKKNEDKSHRVFWLGVTNYRTWVLTALYAASFGVELTMNNIAATYFFDRFDVDLQIAGIIAASFGLMNIVMRSVGGVGSDWCAGRWGMRGRLWWMWTVQTLEGVAAVILGRMDTLAGAIVLLIIFSTFVQASEGAMFGIVPFVSRRALGVISGFVGAGGNAGSAILQAIYFTPDSISTEDGILYTGITVIGVTLLCFIVWFPMWGSMVCPPTKEGDELAYYQSDYNEEEKKQGMAEEVTKFAKNSFSERGSKAMAEAAEAETATGGANA